MKKNAKKKVGLALGSGSSRGWAHIGVIDALVEEGIPVYCLAGTSIGSYISAIYGGGGLDSLKDFLRRMDGKKVFSYVDMSISTTGIINATKKLKELFEMHTAARDFSDLAIPVKMIATDLYSGKKVVLDSGELLPALRASMSLPGLFEPVRYNGRWLVDGGLVDPVPVSVTRAMGADLVVAVDLNADLITGKHAKIVSPAAPAGVERFKSQQFGLIQTLSDGYDKLGGIVKEKMSSFFGGDESAPHIGDVISSSIDIVQDRITKINLAVEPADVLIQPRLGDYSMLDFDRVDDAIREGYELMKERIADLRLLIEE